MIVLKYIGIRGYKSLLDVQMASRNLNVMAGPNASGKSSAIQAMLLLRQSADNDGYIDRLKLSGPLYEAGTAFDAMHSRANHQLSLDIRHSKRANVYRFLIDRNNYDSTIERSIPISLRKKMAPGLTAQGDDFFYLNAERIGPRVIYELPSESVNLSGPLGKNGEYTVSRIAKAQREEEKVNNWSQDLALKFANCLKVIDGLEKKDEILNTHGRIDQLANIFLNWIIPGSDFECQELTSQDSSSLKFRIANFRSVRPTHIGFGLTYTLPVIVAPLLMRNSGIAVIENPEAHLHPYSQSRMGVFLALLANTGRQIFIETHSDHIINGIRLSVKYNCSSTEDIFINNFKYNQSSATTSVRQISIDKRGSLSEWPDGFFDQIESDLSRL